MSHPGTRRATAPTFFGALLAPHPSGSLSWLTESTASAAAWEPLAAAACWATAVRIGLSLHSRVAMLMVSTLRLSVSTAASSATVSWTLRLYQPDARSIASSKPVSTWRRKPSSVPSAFTTALWTSACA
jgi:hypothetical protein